MDVVSAFRKTAWPGCRMVFPEGEEERILAAAAEVGRRRIASPVLLGDREKIEVLAKSLKVSLKGIEVIDTSGGVDSKYVKEYRKVRSAPPALAEKMLSSPLFLGCLMVGMGEADAVIAGAATSSAEVITAAEGMVGLRKGISVPSSFFLMEIPRCSAGEKGLLLFADSSVNIDPSPSELADIAVTTAQTAKELMGWKPRVAMLSFSTKGSAIHLRADKVIEAVKLANRKAPGLAIDGEMQGDSALSMATAKKKMKGSTGKVAGRANVLIFPDLDSGNISYKLVQELAHANAYGPILQGFRKPVSDLSRGAKAKDIVGVAAMLSTWAKRGRKK